MKNEQLTKLIGEMRKLAIEQKVDFWKKIANELEKSTRRKRIVNIEKIGRNINEGEVAVVPGKVLGPGKIKAEIVCHNASESAKKENKIMSFESLMKKNPKAQKCRIIC
ncbi:50S ribosomal protein L18e [Candidatus Woesearchaeota archaeon]|nr:50S ribosomal protein L18e [Candidatus Woesearchaeota archaeon]